MVFTEDVLQLVHVELEIIHVSLMLAGLALKCKHSDDRGNEMKTEHKISNTVTKEHVKNISEVTEVANLC